MYGIALYGLILGTSGAWMAAYLVECIALRRWKLVIGWSDIPFSIECAIYATTGWAMIAWLHSNAIGLSLRGASALAATLIGMAVIYRERNMIPKILGIIKRKGTDAQPAPKDLAGATT